VPIGHPGQRLKECWDEAARAIAGTDEQIYNTVSAYILALQALTPLVYVVSDFPKIDVKMTYAGPK